MIGMGATRKAYLEDGCVAKIPHNRHGVAASAREWELWQNEKFRPYLAEIFEYDEASGTVKMEYLNKCGRVKGDDERIYALFPCELVDLLEGRSGHLQVGVGKDGNIKIFDYGHRKDADAIYLRDIADRDEFMKHRLPDFVFEGEI